MPDGEPVRCDEGWLVTEFAYAEDWPNWEMHPEGDEFVYLLSGAVELHLERVGARETVALEGSGAAVVPRGAWHTAKVRAPSRMLFVTRGAGTMHRRPGFSDGKPPRRSRGGRTGSPAFHGSPPA